MTITLILRVIHPLDGFSYPYYVDEETEAHKGQKTCDSPPIGEWVAGPGSEPGRSNSIPPLLSF